MCPRPPAPRPWAVWIHRTHAAGGASSSTTMVMVLKGCFIFCAVLSGCLYSLYVDAYHKISLQWGYRHSLVGHSGLHHTIRPMLCISQEFPRISQGFQEWSFEIWGIWRKGFPPS
jgi:hypothetical protein